MGKLISQPREYWSLGMMPIQKVYDSRANQRCGYDKLLGTIPRSKNTPVITTETVGLFKKQLLN